MSALKPELCRRQLQPCEIAYLRQQRQTVPWDFSEEPGENARPNLPTEQGRALGREIARLCDVEEARMRERHPKLHPRCVDCAARADTLPNGCEETLMDFLKCAIEGRQFNCHKGVAEGVTPTEPCRGWLLLQMSSAEDRATSIGQTLAHHLRVI